MQTEYEVLYFWFQQLQAEDWFKKSDELDQLIAQRFANLHSQAKLGELFAWRETALGCLAEIIILDQFSRNMFRDTAAMFACDALALSLAQTAVQRGFDKALTQQQCQFLYMPYMHSESKLVHEQALLLFTNLGNENNLDYEIKHKTIIDRFGRYPHRNHLLGRQSTEEELAFLQQPNSSF